MQLVANSEMPHGTVPPPWQFDSTLLSGTAEAPIGFADIFRTADPVPLWSLPGLGHLRRSDTPLHVPGSVTRTLRANGWQPLGIGIFRAKFPVADDEDLVVLFGPYPDCYSLSCLITSNPDPRLLEAIRREDVAPYSVKVTDNGMVQLELRIARQMTYRKSAPLVGRSRRTRTGFSSSARTLFPHRRIPIRQ